MANFNSDLNNLFGNYKNQQKYTQYQKASTKDKKNTSLWKDIDLNKDGKITSADKSKMTNEANTLLKKSTLFDVNKDGKLDQKDIDMFVKGDVNGDGKVDKDELNFVAAYKKELTNAFTKAKADFTLDGKKYVKGKLASGVIDGKFYKNGVLADGTANGKKYVKGVLANGVVSGTLYKDGVAFTGTYTDNKYYKNGKVFTGTVNGATYKAGVLQYSIVDNNGKDYPNASGNTIRFKNGSKIVTLKLNIGEKAVINKDGTVQVTSKDGKTVKKYNKTGKLISTQTSIKPGSVGTSEYIGKCLGMNIDESKWDIKKDSQGRITEMSPKSSNPKIVVSGTGYKIAYSKTDGVISITTVPGKGLVGQAPVTTTYKNTVIQQRTWSDGLAVGPKMEAKYVENYKNGKLATLTKNYANPSAHNGVAKEVTTYKADGKTIESVKKYDAQGNLIPDTPVIKPGARGSIEFIEKLLGSKFNKITNVKYDKEGMVTGFSADGLDYTAWWPLNSLHLTSSYKDNAGLTCSKDLIFNEKNVLEASTVSKYNGQKTIEVESYDKNGDFAFSIVDKGSAKRPCIAGYAPGDCANIAFNDLDECQKKGTEYITVDVRHGDKAVINADGTVQITRADSTVEVYDVNGKLIKTVKPTPKFGSMDWLKNVLGADFANNAFNSVSCDNQGRITKLVPYDKSSPKFKGDGKTYFISYADDGSFKIATKLDDVQEAKYFNKDGVLTKTAKTTYFNNGQLEDRICEYDKSGKITSELVEIRDQKTRELQSSNLQKFDAQGRLISHEYTFGNKAENKHISQYAYDNAGNIVATKDSEFLNGKLNWVAKSERSYDSAGRLIKMTTTEYDGNEKQTLLGTQTWNYFESGQLANTTYKNINADGSFTTGQTDFNGNGVMTHTYAASFDKEGKNVSFEDRRYDKDGSLLGVEAKRTIQPGASTTIYENGMAIEVAYTDYPIYKGKETPAKEISYTIDANGHMEMNADGLEISAKPFYISKLYSNGNFLVTDEGSIKTTGENHLITENGSIKTTGQNIKIENLIAKIPQTWWGSPLTDLTINGNGNKIKGSPKDDSIEVRGDNNYVNLGLGKNDKLKIYGSNNTVEDPDGINIVAAEKPIKYIEEHINTDGSKVKTIGYEDGTKDVIYSYDYMNRQEVINYDAKGNAIGGTVTGSDESTLWGGPTQKYKTKAEAELALKKFVNEWTSSYTEKYLETSTFWLKMLAEKTNLGDDKYIDITNAQTKVLTTVIKQNKDGSYYFEARISQSFDFNVLDKKIIQPTVQPKPTVPTLPTIPTVPTKPTVPTVPPTPTPTVAPTIFVNPGNTGIIDIDGSDIYDGSGNKIYKTVDEKQLYDSNGKKIN